MSSSLRLVAIASIAAVFSVATVAVAQTDQASRRYHPVYFDEHSLTYEPSAGDPDAPLSQQVPLYQVSYPKDWRKRGLKTPQCAPCDHVGDGVTWEDFHDHVAGRGPTEAGRQPKWHVYGVVPAYSGKARNDAAIAKGYASRLPVRSDIEVMRLLTTTLPNGDPVARIADYGFNFTAPFVPNSKRTHAVR